MHRLFAVSTLILGGALLAVAGSVPAVPEPGSFLLLAGGLAVSVLFLRMKRNSG
jgi:hypothetical protein